MEAQSFAKLVVVCLNIDFLVYSFGYVVSNKIQYRQSQYSE